MRRHFKKRKDKKQVIYFYIQDCHFLLGTLIRKTSNVLQVLKGGQLGVGMRAGSGENAGRQSTVSSKRSSPHHHHSHPCSHPEPGRWSFDVCSQHMSECLLRTHAQALDNYRKSVGIFKSHVLRAFSMTSLEHEMVCVHHDSDELLCVPRRLDITQVSQQKTSIFTTFPICWQSSQK